MMIELRFIIFFFFPIPSHLSLLPSPLFPFSFPFLFLDKAPRRERWGVRWEEGEGGGRWIGAVEAVGSGGILGRRRRGEVYGRNSVFSKKKKKNFSFHSSLFFLLFSFFRSIYRSYFIATGSVRLRLRLKSEERTSHAILLTLYFFRDNWGSYDEHDNSFDDDI